MATTELAGLGQILFDGPIAAAILTAASSAGVHLTNKQETAIYHSTVSAKPLEGSSMPQDLCIAPGTPKEAVCVLKMIMQRFAGGKIMSVREIQGMYRLFVGPQEELACSSRTEAQPSQRLIASRRPASRRQPPSSSSSDRYRYSSRDDVSREGYSMQVGPGGSVMLVDSSITL